MPPLTLCPAALLLVLNAVIFTVTRVLFHNLIMKKHQSDFGKLRISNMGSIDSLMVRHLIDQEVVGSNPTLDRTSFLSLIRSLIILNISYRITQILLCAFVYIWPHFKSMKLNRTILTSIYWPLVLNGAIKMDVPDIFAWIRMALNVDLFAFW